VIAPLRCPESQIIDFIQRRQSWIKQHLEKIRPLQEAIACEQKQIPRSLPLRAIDRDYEIEIVAKPGWQGREKWSIEGDRLILAGSLEEPALMQTILRKFVRQQAQQHLNRELDALSRQHGLTYQSSTIRRQKTRWGSCSSRGNISLNEQLMFFPRSLMLHVLLHELAHTVHHNHGHSFYQLLSKLDPGMESNKRQLRHAAKHIPLWYQAGA
jgi:hypothetical protein